MERTSEHLRAFSDTSPSVVGFDGQTRPSQSAPSGRSVDGAPPVPRGDPMHSPGAHFPMVMESIDPLMTEVPGSSVRKVRSANHLQDRIDEILQRGKRKGRPTACRRASLRPYPKATVGVSIEGVAPKDSHRSYLKSRRARRGFFPKRRRSRRGRASVPRTAEEGYSSSASRRANG